MDAVQKTVKGVTLHLEPVDGGKIRIVFAIDGQIREEDTVSMQELRSRLPGLAIRALACLGGQSPLVEQGVRQLGQIMEILR